MNIDPGIPAEAGVSVLQEVPGLQERGVPLELGRTLSSRRQQRLLTSSQRRDRRQRRMYFS